MLLKTTGLLLSALLLLSGCSGHNTSIETNVGGESLSSFKVRKASQSENCIKTTDIMIEKAKAGTITRTEFEDFRVNGLFGCRNASFPREIFSIQVNESIDYLSPNARLFGSHVRLMSIKLWFMHQLIQYSDLKDPNIRHEAWTTFRSPSVEVSSPGGGVTKFNRSFVTNLPFVNPIERVKANAPSLVENFMGEQRDADTLSVRVKDPNEFATTWVGEIQYNIPTEERRQKMDLIYSALDWNERYLQDMGYNQDFNNASKYESIRHALTNASELIATL